MSVCTNYNCETTKLPGRLPASWMGGERFIWGLSVKTKSGDDGTETLFRSVNQPQCYRPDAGGDIQSGVTFDAERLQRDRVVGPAD